MKFFCKNIFLLVPIMFLVAVTGCGGFGASGTVSPLMFLLPGLGKNNSNQISLTNNYPCLVNSGENRNVFETNYFSKN